MLTIFTCQRGGCGKNWDGNSLGGGLDQCVALPWVKFKDGGRDGEVDCRHPTAPTPLPFLV